MPKQLAEFLKEQQKPFVLEAYLLERGCYHSQKNRLHSPDGGSRYCSTMAIPSCLKRSVIWGLKRNPNFVPNCSKVVRALFTKLFTVYNNKKIGNSQIRYQNTCEADTEKRKHENAHEDEFSSGSSSTVFNSCSESDAEHAQFSPGNADIFLAADHQESPEVVYVLTENEVVAGWKFRWRNAEEDRKQLSPVSVLEETESYSDSPPVEGEDTTKQKRELKKSVSRCKEEKEKPIYNYKRTLEEVQEFVGSKSNSHNVSSHYSKNKKAVRQTKQLLFDCIREVVELGKESSGGQQLKGILGAEQLWELICENLCLWSKESINETNIIHLLQSEVVLVSAQEWSDLEKQTQVIGSHLGDAILEDICNEFIVEMR